MKKIGSFKVKGGAEFKSFSNKDKYKHLYNSPHWGRYSRDFLSHNDQCYRCGSDSEVTDHLEPHKGNILKFWNEENYIPLCERCHNMATSKFEMSWKGLESLKQKVKWINSNRRVNQITTKVIILPIPKEVFQSQEYKQSLLSFFSPS